LLELRHVHQFALQQCSLNGRSYATASVTVVNKQPAVSYSSRIWIDWHHEANYKPVINGNENIFATPIHPKKVALLPVMHSLNALNA